MATTERRLSAAVWDPLVRVLHWSLAASIAAAWITRRGGGIWHERLGYASLLIVTLRLVWGWRGPRYARFGQLVREPAATLDYAGQMLTRNEARHIGHNALGGWMILALLSGTAYHRVMNYLYFPV